MWKITSLHYNVVNSSLYITKTQLQFLMVKEQQTYIQLNDWLGTGLSVHLLLHGH